MADPPEPTEERRSEASRRLLAAAADLASRCGYHGFGINQVLELASTGNGSLYHAFPNGKAELVANAVAEEAAQVLALARATLASEGPELATRLVFDLARRELERTDFAHGCRVTTALADGADVEAVRAAGAEVLAAWQQLVSDALVDAGAPRRRATATASAMLSMYVGAWITSRTSRSSAPMTSARDAAVAMVAAALVPGAGARTRAGAVGRAPVGGQASSRTGRSPR